MRDIRIATAQFSGIDLDKEANFAKIERLAHEALEKGAEAILFHEMCVTHYTFMQSLTRAELFDLAEEVPAGPSSERVCWLAENLNLLVSVGLLEKEGEHLYNTQIVAGPEGFMARHRKIHAFINREIESGDEHTVFDWRGCRFGVLTCYDNNLPENVRIAALKGAEIVFMPHVTGGTESPEAGRGIIPRELWENRGADPVPLRRECDGPKGREWLMRWLPARAWENGVYAIFANPIGPDHNTVKPGCSMILDPNGSVVAECRSVEDEVAVAACPASKYETASGRRYLRARRPDLYSPLVQPPPPGQEPHTDPGWKLA
jgi:predicted amidohydrolase